MWGAIQEVGSMQCRGEVRQALTAASKVTPSWLHKNRNSKIHAQELKMRAGVGVPANHVKHVLLLQRYKVLPYADY